LKLSPRHRHHLNNDFDQFELDGIRVPSALRKECAEAKRREYVACVRLNVNQNNKYRDILQDTKVRSRRLHEPHGLEILEHTLCRYDIPELFSRR
jgi:hypothetical protein